MKLTKQQAAIISAYTNILIGNFSDFHEYIEQLLGRPVWTHELMDPEVTREIKEKSKSDFLSLNP